MNIGAFERETKLCFSSNLKPIDHNLKKKTYIFGSCTTAHVEVMDDQRELEGVAVHRIYNSTLTTVFPISEIITKRKENKKIQHVGAGQQESFAAYRWSNGMEKFSTETLCKNLDRTSRLYRVCTQGTECCTQWSASLCFHKHRITLTRKVLSLAVYYSNQSSLTAARCNLFNKRWDMQNGMC